MRINKDGIERIGKLSADFLKSRQASEEIIQDQKAILRELINCSLRFSRYERPNSSLTIRIHVDEGAVRTEVTTLVHRSSCHKFAELEETIQLLRGYQNPLEAYLLKCRQVSQKAGDGEGIGLGLARITHENQAIVDFFVNEKRILSLSADRHFDGKGQNLCERGGIHR